MQTLSRRAMNALNTILRKWRRTGRDITVSELYEAHRLAREAERAQNIVRERRLQTQLLEQQRELLALGLAEAEQIEAAALERLHERHPARGQGLEE